MSFSPIQSTLLQHVAEAARRSGIFASVETSGSRLECAALASSSSAFYRVEFEGVELWVSLVTPDRYLSQSIELDLVHTGDKLEELLEEELVDLGYNAGSLRFEHFRSEEKLFTFRSKLPAEARDPSFPDAAKIAATCLLAYEACFRRLGNMAGNETEDE